jgi:hypothetical protein
MNLGALVDLGILASEKQLMVAMGNVAGATAQGRRPSSPAAQAAAQPGSAPSARQAAIPVAFHSLKLDLPELMFHLANSKEIYTARAAIGGNANQLHGTMLNVLDSDDDDGDDDMVGEMDEEGPEENIAAEFEIEGAFGYVEAEAAAEPGEADNDNAEHEEGAWEMERVGGGGLDARA